MKFKENLNENNLLVYFVKLYQNSDEIKNLFFENQNHMASKYPYCLKTTIITKNIFN